MCTTNITDLPGLARFGEQLRQHAEAAEAAAPFDAVELELLAEVVDGLLSIDEGARELGVIAGISGSARALVADLGRRCRAQAAAMVAAEVPSDLQRAVDEAAEDLAGRLGRSAIVQITPAAFVVVGMADDVELEWVTVRGIGQLIVTEKSSVAEMCAARDLTRAEAGA
jgi:hypothetical protein